MKALHVNEKILEEHLKSYLGMHSLGTQPPGCEEVQAGCRVWVTR